MKYAIAFGLLAVYCCVEAVMLGGVGWLLFWPGVSGALLAAGYAGLGPVVCGKRVDGRLAWWAVLLLFPYFGLTWLAWYVQRLVSREECCNEVAPGLWIGRRVFARELPPGIALVVDLTAEFPEPRGVMRGRSYLSVPVLDALGPPVPVFRKLIAEVASTSGPVFIHCAAGHGRSALVAAGVLLSREAAPDAAEAIAMVRRARPAARLNAAQRRLLESLAATIPELP
jgi:protein-tyrosine phosphatase